MPRSHTRLQEVGTLIYQCVTWRKSATGETCLQQQLTEITKKNFYQSIQRQWRAGTGEEKKQQQERQLQSFLRYTQTQ